MSSIKFGFCVPIFANPGMILFRTPGYKKLDYIQDPEEKKVINYKK